MVFVKHGGSIVTHSGATVNYTPPMPPLLFTVNIPSDNYKLSLPVSNTNWEQYTTTNSSSTYTTTDIMYGDQTSYLYDFVVDWGDGTPVSTKIIDADSPLTQHFYATAGQYQVSIKGILEFFGSSHMLIDDDPNWASFQNTIVSMDSWGDTGLRQISFNNCRSLKTLPTDGSKIFNMIYFENVFRENFELRFIPSDLFAYSPDVLTFYNTFLDCGKIAGTVPDLWNTHTSASSSHGHCFAGLSSTTISNWSDIPTSWKSY